jgi:chromosome segregation ATPase
MSYLLAQILICLLIAGLIGLVIGWLLRGGCSGKLKENDRHWTDKFNAHDSSWRTKHQGLMDEQEGHLENTKNELSTLKNKLILSTSKIRELNNQNLHLLTEKNQVEMDYSEKLKASEATYKTRIYGLKNQLLQTEEELKIKGNHALKLESSVKTKELELEEKLKSSEVSWKSKIQGMMSQDSSRKEQQEEEIKTLKEKLFLSESAVAQHKEDAARCKELEIQVNKEKSEANASKNKLFSSNNEFNTNLEKIKKEHRDAMAQKEARLLSLQQRITAAEAEIEEYKKGNDPKNKS